MFGPKKPKYEEFEDADLLAKYKAEGNGEYIGVLFKRYMHLVFGVCMKYLKNEDESKDAAMQIFEKLFVDIDKHEIANFRGWLHIVSKNFCLMQLRSVKNRTRTQSKEFEESDIKDVEFDSPMHLSSVEEKEVKLDKLEYCITQLKDDQKRCIELFYLKEKCYQEIALETRYDVKKVKSYIQNGKRNLKICMTGSE